MRNHLSKIFTCLLLVAVSVAAIAQQSQTAPQPITEKQIKNTQVNTAAELVNNVDALVKLSDDQKAKLQTALQQSVVKSEEARQAIKSDDSKLQAWREAKVADIITQMKLILTPEQFDKVMKAGKTN